MDAYEVLLPLFLLSFASFLKKRSNVLATPIKLDATIDLVEFTFMYIPLHANIKLHLMKFNISLIN